MMRDTTRAMNILLVGFQDQDNLGLRYLMSSVRAAGFEAEILTYQADPEPILDYVRSKMPDVIGFSLIFQYMAPDFARVIDALRQGGVGAHITMGGHYPSFDYGEVLEKMPGLDSIVRYEGEATLVELLQKLQAEEDWRTVPGIAFRDATGVTATPLRPAIADLDTLPLPYRNDIFYEEELLPTASMLGSRGCPWDCSFCSIRPFYEAQEGPLRRLRQPKAIADEMAQLYHERGVSIFLFQDDDFMAGGRNARRWAEQVADEIIQAGLGGKIIFKISCRSDEIYEDCLRKLMEGGLTHIYMGVESGDEQGLLNLNKRLKPADHLKAGSILKSLGLSFDFGFMLLEPYSTFEIVRNNIDFLEAFVGDGWSVACFCRMLPYAGTPVKRRLEAEGRLLGTPFEPDYHFLDPKLDIFYDWMLDTFYERNFTNTGLCHILKSLLFEAHIQSPEHQVFNPVERAFLHHLTAVCNGVAFYTLRSAIQYLESHLLYEIQQDRTFLANLTYHERQEEQRLLGQIADLNWAVRHKQQLSNAPSDGKLLGAFDKTWTVAESHYRQPINGSGKF